ncbi:MAG: PIN domain-containing protein [Anaerolineae bacterium]
MASPTVLIDLNVLLDVLQYRQPFYAASATLLAYAENGCICGIVAAHSFTNLFYLLQKSGSAEQARAAITRMLQFLAVAPVDKSTVDQALHLPYRDFDDAVQMVAALQVRADYLATRDLKAYQPALVPVVTPAELLALL